MYTLTLIQGIDQFLLDICIELIVKRIDADRLFKISGKSAPISGTGKAMIVKLRSLPMI